MKMPPEAMPPGAFFNFPALSACPFLLLHFHNSSTENSAWQFGQEKYGLRKSTVPIILPSSVEKS